uniref:Endonuclease/exonuclease/phosphatase domain-containing protein n=1 Tax=Aegilops tauschii subsp. strangulata TaxID=200361 RepID=A0A452ZUV6_AEGTS
MQRRHTNIRHVTRLCGTLDPCEIKEIHLQNRKFTWCNERPDPTLCKPDSYFRNTYWDLHFENHVLAAPSSALSDHLPLFLASDHGLK